MAYIAVASDEVDRYGNPIQYQIKDLQPVSDGNFLRDKKGNKIFAVRPSVKGRFDKPDFHTVATITQNGEAEMSMPIDFKELVDNIILLINGVNPAPQTTDYEFRYHIDGPSLQLKFRDPERDGVTTTIATITNLSKNHDLLAGFGESLSAIYDRKGNKGSKLEKTHTPIPA